MISKATTARHYYDVVPVDRQEAIRETEQPEQIPFKLTGKFMKK